MGKSLYKLVNETKEDVKNKYAYTILSLTKAFLTEINKENKK